MSVEPISIPYFSLPAAHRSSTPPLSSSARRWRTSPRTRILIEEAVTQVFGVAQDDLAQATRGNARVALARQVAMYIAHTSCGMTLTEVGALFGRDRTTVAHACHVVEDRRDDPLFERALGLLEWVVPQLISSQHSILVS